LFETNLQKITTTTITKTRQVWWYIPVIPSTQEMMEIGYLQSKSCPGKCMRPFLKNKLKQ
jgi:hypothetical protein